MDGDTCPICRSTSTYDVGVRGGTSCLSCLAEFRVVQVAGHKPRLTSALFHQLVIDDQVPDDDPA